MNQNNQSASVTFEDEEFQRSVASSQVQKSKIVQLVMQGSGGLITDEKQAQYVLMGFVAIAAIFVSVLMFSDGGRSAKFEAPPGQKIIYPENGPPRLEQKR